MLNLNLNLAFKCKILWPLSKASFLKDLAEAKKEKLWNSMTLKTLRNNWKVVMKMDNIKTKITTMDSLTLKITTICYNIKTKITTIDSLKTKITTMVNIKTKMTTMENTSQWTTLYKKWVTQCIKWHHCLLWRLVQIKFKLCSMENHSLMSKTNKTLGTNQTN